MYRIFLVVILFLYITGLYLTTQLNNDDEQRQLNISVETKSLSNGKWKINVRVIDPIDNVSYFLYPDTNNAGRGINLTASPIVIKPEPTDVIFVSCVRNKHEVKLHKILNDYIYRPNYGYYKLKYTAAEWKAASLNCAKEDAYLAIPNSKAEADVLIDIFKETPIREQGDQNLKYIWLGFYKPNQNDTKFFTPEDQSLESSEYLKNNYDFNVIINSTGVGVLHLEESLELWNNSSAMLNYFCKRNL